MQFTRSLRNGLRGPTIATAASASPNSATAASSRGDAVHRNTDGARQAGAVSRLLTGEPARKQEWLDGETAFRESGGDGRWHQYSSLLEDLNAEREAKAWAREKGATPEQLAALDERTARYQQALDRTKIENKAEIALKTALVDVRNKTLKEAKRQNGEARVYEVKLRDGASIPALLTLRGERQQHRQKVDEAPIRKQTAKSQLETECNAHAARGRLGLTLSLEPTGQHPRAGLRHQVSIRRPTEVLRAEPLFDGDLPVITDALSLFFALDDIYGGIAKKQLLAEFDPLYEGIDIALDPDERRQQLREIDREILQIEREIAELAWAEIFAGKPEAAAALADLHPKAVLGIA